jgi:hypothetical protein
MLNNLDGDFLAKTAKDLDIHLASDKEGVKNIFQQLKLRKF